MYNKPHLFHTNSPVGPMHTLCRPNVPHCGWQYHNNKENTFRMFSSEGDMTAYSDLRQITEKVFFERVIHSQVFTGNKEAKMLVLASRGEING